MLAPVSVTEPPEPLLVMVSEPPLVASDSTPESVLDAPAWSMVPPLPVMVKSWVGEASMRSVPPSNTGLTVAGTLLASW